MRATIISDVDEIVLNAMPFRMAPMGVWGILKDGVDGLFGSPAVRESDTAIPQQDGSYWPSRFTSDHRIVTIRGFVRLHSSVEAADVRDRICDLMCRPLTLIVQQASKRWHLDCFMSADPEPLMRFAERAFSFTLILTCPDPLKYGDPVTFVASNGVARVENAGRVPSFPKIHISGRCTSLSLSYGSRSVRWSGDTTSLDLDLRDMLPSSGAVSGQAFRIEPGSSVVGVNATSGANVGIIVSPAWR